MAETPAGLLLREREETRRLLTDGYAEDWIDQEELERRLELAEHAATIAELRALTVELRPAEAPAATAPATTTALAVVSATAPVRIPALFSAVERVGAWRVPARMQVRATFGAVTLDLRQAVLPAGTREIEVEVKVFCGSLDLIVPPGWAIDNRCGAVLGSIEQEECGAAPAGERWLLRLTGRVLFGSLSVCERLPGEGGRAARRRRRDEQRALAERPDRALPRGDD